MIETYTAISNRFNFFHAEFKKLKEGAAQGDNEQYSHDARLYSPIPSLEIDLFVKAFPDSNKKQLEFYYDWYLDLLDKIELFERSLSMPDKWITNWLINDLEIDVRELVIHLSDILFPEPEIQELPQKFERLGPTEKILIIHYLKIASLRPCQLGLKPGVFFLSRLLDINPESIKKPLLKLDDYTTNRLTEAQAQTIYPTLEKVKSFFDNSDLYKISSVINARINELKRISGKD